MLLLHLLTLPSHHESAQLHKSKSKTAVEVKSQHWNAVEIIEKPKHSFKQNPNTRRLKMHPIQNRSNTSCFVLSCLVVSWILTASSLLQRTFTGVLDLSWRKGEDSILVLSLIGFHRGIPVNSG